MSYRENQENKGKQQEKSGEIYIGLYIQLAVGKLGKMLKNMHDEVEEVGKCRTIVGKLGKMLENMHDEVGKLENVGKQQGNLEKCWKICMTGQGHWEMQDSTYGEVGKLEICSRKIGECNGEVGKWENVGQFVK